MKKGLLLILLSFCLIVTTGCGKKIEQLNCTTTLDMEDGTTLKQNVVVTFEGVKATEMNMEMIYTLSDTLVPEIDTLKETLEDELAKDGVQITTAVENNVITMNLLYDIENMTKEQREELELENIYGTAEATKEEFEKLGYTCK